MVVVISQKPAQISKPESKPAVPEKKPQTIAETKPKPAVPEKKPQTVAETKPKPAAEKVAAATAKPPSAKTEALPAPQPKSKPQVAALGLSPVNASPREPEPVSVALAKAKPAVVEKPAPAIAQAPKVREVVGVQPVNLAETASIKLAKGFDFPIGKPNGEGYYKARGYRPNGHLGDDWNGVKGGDTDLGDPIFSIADGVVVFARDIHMGWGNVLIVRHAFREGGTVKQVDALYGHLQKIQVKKGQIVTRGQKIATLGNAHGLYDAHLHFEIRKNVEIGISRAAFKRDYSNYYDPTQFILTHRNLPAGGQKYRVALNTFAKDRLINFDRKRRFTSYRGGTSQSAAALKKAVAQKKSG